MGMSAAHCQGNVREFQNVWRVVTLYITCVCVLLSYAPPCIGNGMDGSIRHPVHLFIYLFIYYTVYTHVKSFTIVKNRKCGQVTSHCRKAQPYRADLSLFLNVPVVTVKSEITV